MLVVPEQIVFTPVIFTLGIGFIISVLVATAVHPFALVPVTTYVPAEDRLILAVVAPVFHIYDDAPAAVNVVLVPAQISLLPDILTDGNVLTVNVLVAVAEHPPPFVTVIVYKPATETLIQLVLAPVLHK